MALQADIQGKWPDLNRSQRVPIGSQLELFCNSVNGEIFSLGLQAWMYNQNYGMKWQPTSLHVNQFLCHI